MRDSAYSLFKSKTIKYAIAMLDMVIGALIGQPCDICKVRTMFRRSYSQGCITWCGPCTRSEFWRLGL